MHSDDFDRCAIKQVVAAALRAEAPDLAPLPSGGWGFALANGSPARVRARVTGGEWLEFLTPVKGVAFDVADAGWSLLAINARLTGTARIASMPGEDLQLRAEVRVGADEDGAAAMSGWHGGIGDDVRRVCGDVRAALHRIHHHLQNEPHDRLHEYPHDPLRKETATSADALSLDWPPEAPDLSGATHLAELCAEAGWPATLRSSGEAIVAIEGRHATYQARLALAADRSLHAVVTFDDARPGTPLGRAAMAALLLRLSATVRLVKGAVVRHGDEVHPGIAAACVPPRTAADIGRVLGALTVGCALAGREVRALADEGLARAYLAQGGAHGTVLDETQTVHESTTETEEERTCLQQR
jgi:hypothetical protein